MIRRPSLLRGAAALAAAAAVTLTFREWSRADKPPPAKPDPSAVLGGAERFLSHVSTDKPIYRIGERVYIRSVLLNAADRTPLKADRQIGGVVEIKGPKGDILASGWITGSDSTVGFVWDVPEGTAGGEYTLRITYPNEGFTPAERKFDVRAYRAPRLKSQITFVRDGYGPGDRVSAALHVERAEGGIPEKAKVTGYARVDGVQVWTGVAAVDAGGNAYVAFDLPKEISRGEGTLAMVIEDGGISETASKTLPILVQSLDVQAFPEGGDLVAGLSNWVYLEARTPAKKPADIAGNIVDSRGKTVAAFRTSHEGRGAFAFVPAKGESYSLAVTEPAGIKRTIPLPAAKETGVVLSAVDYRTPAGKPVGLTVSSTTTGKVVVTLSKREIELAKTEVDLKAGEPAKLLLEPKGAAEGVLIATVRDAKRTPLAERLVYRHPAKGLRVTVTADKTRPVPGEKVQLTIKTTDADGKPVSAAVGVTVTDDSVLQMIEKRERAPRLAAMVMLESEVRELADAGIYGDASDPKAGEATDLLLGTQGWRRFALVNTPKFLEAGGDAARRVLALRIETERDVRALALGGAVAEGKADGLPVPRNAVPEDEGPVSKAKNGDDKSGVKVEKHMAGDVADQRADLRKALEAAEKQNAAKDIAAGAPAIREPHGDRLSEMKTVRLYAHDLRAGRRPADRVDFAETLYWSAALRTDPKTGEAVAEFALSDAVTAFNVSADAFASDGSLGQGDAAVESVQPFYIEPKLPLEVTSGDLIRLPVGVVNSTPELSQVRLAVAAESKLAGWAGELTISGAEPFTPKAARDRRLIDIRIGRLNGSADLVVSAQAGAFADSVTRRLTVKPFGFPVEAGFGGMVSSKAKVGHKVVIPAEVVARSIETNVAIYPTPLASMTEALQRLLQEPSGCFEQTSSTTYPLVMAQQYFTTHVGVDPKLIEQGRVLLEKGYNRLIGFECKQKGYEWFGADPGHDSLTAYGLMEFTDMAQVRAVDPAMLARTREWLLAQRDGKGGFARKTHTYHVWVNTPEVSNGYTTWALLESGQNPADLARETAWLKGAAAATRNLYVVAQAANVMALAGDKAESRKLMDRLAAAQKESGVVAGGTETMVGSTGEALDIETTSMAILAWLREPAYAGSVEKSIRWLADCCKAGRFGNTQSTILALRAIVTYDKSRAKPKAAGRAQLLVNGRTVGGPVAFGDSQQGPIKLPDFSELLTKGKEHVIELVMEEGSEMPYAVTVKYNTAKPNSSEQCKVGVTVSLSDKTVTEGNVTEANVVVTNRSKDVVPTPVSIIGLPGGLEPRHDQLKELVKAGKVAAYEVVGREVVLYWRALAGGEKVELPISLTAAIPGVYTGPASRAYLYYSDEHKSWVDGLKVEITARD